MTAKNDKVRWTEPETISTICATSVANELENMSPDDSAVLITDIFVKTLYSTREAYS